MLEAKPAHGRYTLRPVVESDFDFLWALKVATLKGYIEELYGWDEAVAGSVLQAQTMKDAHLVQIDGEPAGVLKVTEEGGFVQIAEIGLLPAYQGRGLGTQVIEDVIALADRKGLPVELQVFSNNPAGALYKRLGFTVSHHKMFRAAKGEGS